MAQEKYEKPNPKTQKIKMLRELGRPEGNVPAGEVVELPFDEARNLVDQGAAEAA